MRKAAAVALTVPALSAPHKLGDCLAAARTTRCHRLTLVRRSRGQHCGPSRPMRCRPCMRLGCWIRCAKGFDTCITAGAPSRHTCIGARPSSAFTGRHPRDLGAAEVEAFLTWLADERQLATSTHKQALSALIFLYSKVLQVSLPWVTQLERPRVRQRLPVAAESRRGGVHPDADAGRACPAGTAAVRHRHADQRGLAIAREGR